MLNKIEIDAGKKLGYNWKAISRAQVLHHKDYNN